MQEVVTIFSATILQWQHKWSLSRDEKMEHQPQAPINLITQLVML